MKIFLKLAAVSLLASACTALQSAGKVETTTIAAILSALCKM